MSDKGIDTLTIPVGSHAAATLIAGFAAATDASLSTRPITSSERLCNSGYNHWAHRSREEFQRYGSGLPVVGPECEDLRARQGQHNFALLHGAAGFEPMSSLQVPHLDAGIEAANAQSQTEHKTANRHNTPNDSYEPASA